MAVISSVSGPVHLHEHVPHALLGPIFRFTKLILGDVVLRVVLSRLSSILSTKSEVKVLPSIVHIDLVLLGIEKPEMVGPPLSVGASIAMLVPGHLEPKTISGSLMPLTEVKRHFSPEMRNELGDVKDEGSLQFALSRV